MPLHLKWVCGTSGSASVILSAPCSAYRNTLSPRLNRISTLDNVAWKSLATASIFIYAASSLQVKAAAKWANTSGDAPWGWLGVTPPVLSMSSLLARTRCMLGRRCVTLSCCGNIKNSPTNLCEAQGQQQDTPTWGRPQDTPLLSRHPARPAPPRPNLPLILWQTTDRSWGRSFSLITWHIVHQFRGQRQERSRGHAS